MIRPSPQASAKTERLLNLVICLLYTRRPLTKDQIRSAVAAYAEANGPAFDRMFERDKDELRELGIPLTAVQLDAFFEDEIGYRIDKRDYALPEITFLPDELTVLGLASRTWAQASLAGPASLALHKLAAAGVERDDASLVGLEPRVRTTEPAFEAVRKAAVTRTPIRLDYRKSRAEAPETRVVEPWSMLLWRGRWYVVGHDRGRDDVRVFRLARIVGPVTSAGRPGSFEVPPDHDPKELIARFEPASTAPVMSAAVRVREGRGHELRRRATEVRPDGDGWDVVRLDSDDLRRLGQELAAHGDAVVALEPPDLVEDVVRRLRGVADLDAPGEEAP